MGRGEMGRSRVDIFNTRGRGRHRRRRGAVREGTYRSCVDKRTQLY